MDVQTVTTTDLIIALADTLYEDFAVTEGVYVEEETHTKHGLSIVLDNGQRFLISVSTITKEEAEQIDQISAALDLRRMTSE